MTLREALEGRDPVAFLSRQVERRTIHRVSPHLADLRMHDTQGLHKDVLNHSIKVLANAIRMEDHGLDVVLRAAALLHDIGKPATRLITPDGNVSFTHHEFVGARMIPKVLAGQGFSTREVRQVKELVRLHMRSHGFRESGRGAWSDSAVRRFMRDLPEDEEQVRRLFILYRSDVTSKNPKRRAKIRRTIDRLEAAMARVKAADERQAARPALDGHDVMEMFNLTPGRRLGEVMRFLNSDEGIRLGRAEVVEAIRSRFPSLESESSSSVTGNTDGSGVW